jgi:hypothetical protein
MTDEELRDTFHRVEFRLERLDTKLDALEKGLNDLCGEVRAKLEGLKTRLNTKASSTTVGLWGATLAFLISAVGVAMGVLLQLRP